MKSKAFKPAISEEFDQEEDFATGFIPLVRADALNVLVVEFEKRGIDLTEPLKEANISREMLSDNQNMIASKPIMVLTELIYKKSGLFPYVESIRHTLRTVLIPEFVKTLPKNLTIREVLTNFNLLIRDSIPASSQFLEVDETTAWFSTANREQGVTDWREIFTVMYCVELMRSLTNNVEWLPKSVSLRQFKTGDFARNIPSNVQLLFSQKLTKVSIDLELLEQIIDTPYPEPEPREIVWHSTFTDTLYTALQPYVNEQSLNIDMAANLFEMSTRTLQRKLQQEKNSFRAIKNSLMFNTACELMSRNLSLTQVSVQLGYADISHFSRAFKRFSSLTPKLYQTALIKDRDS
ncbi:helix-turn-helix transcriptional regulator [Vibrio superstes]|uniref:HTH araC/xylS-type domain-containing protein n=1 Tax=Vibrio superstes NBRC 103154 TaxID=1219062 RepID=A0A511QPN4_9VIBR|nr:helix-turn-helix transcriptional regulator [Vibrio superstes]GEM79295.1 hypothetical protein VSU01S_15400 [Vibrio superstes NBRC 103154]